MMPKSYKPRVLLPQHYSNPSRDRDRGIRFANSIQMQPSQESELMTIQQSSSVVAPSFSHSLNSFNCKQSQSKFFVLNSLSSKRHLFRVSSSLPFQYQYPRYQELVSGVQSHSQSFGFQNLHFEPYQFQFQGQSPYPYSYPHSPRFRYPYSYPQSMAKFIVPPYSNNPNMGLTYSRTDVNQMQMQVRRYYSRDTIGDSEGSKSKLSLKVEPETTETAETSAGLTHSRLGVDQSLSLSPKEISRRFIKEIADLRNRLKSLRKWEYTQLGKLIGNSRDHGTVGHGTRFSVMCYNILAQNLLIEHMNLYKSCDSRALNHSFRKQLFFSELDDIRPDILCLQEVTEVDYYKVHEPTLFLKGFKGIFKKRTGDKLDGCAIFYNTTRFSFVDKLAVEYFQPHSNLLNRDNVGLFIKLKTNKYGTAAGRQETFVVGTTHILFNPKRVDVKLAQIQLLLAELDRFGFSGVDPKGNPIYLPIILTGDFNLEPTSALIRFLTSGILRQNSEDSLSPHLGISDQCQHYKVVLERLKHWQKYRRPNFQLDSKVVPSLVNLRTNSMIPNPELVLGDDAYNVEICNSDLFPPLTASEQGQAPKQTQTQDKAGLKKSVTFSDEVEVESPPKLSDADRLGLEEYRSFSSQRLSANIESSASVPPVPLEVELNQTEHNKILDSITKYGKVCTFNTGDLKHDFRLNNVYAPQLDRGEGSQATVTTKQVGWTTVDYIFYSKVWNEKYKKQTEGKLRLIRRLGLLTRDQCKELGPIPNFAVSSDHYSLVAEFVLK